MDVEIKDLNANKFRALQWFVGECRAYGLRVWFADYGIKGGVQQWLVHDPGWGDLAWSLHSTEEMKIGYRSVRDVNNQPIPVDDEQTVFLASLISRMKLKDGCPGCRYPWGTPARPGQCKKCKRCQICCLDVTEKYSCAYRRNQRAG